MAENPNHLTVAHHVQRLVFSDLHRLFFCWRRLKRLLRTMTDLCQNGVSHIAYFFKIIYRFIVLLSLHVKSRRSNKITIYLDRDDVRVFRHASEVRGEVKGLVGIVANSIHHLNHAVGGVQIGLNDLCVIDEVCRWADSLIDCKNRCPLFDK